MHALSTKDFHSRYSFTILLFIALVLEGIFLYLRSLPDWYFAMRRVVPMLCGGFVVYLAALGVCRRAGRDDRGLLTLILIAAVVFRCTLLTIPPPLTQDFYRYLWDGDLSRHGLNPYRYGPKDPAVRPLYNMFHHREWIVAPGHAANYPTLAEMLFAAAAFRQHSLNDLLPLKVLILLFDLASIGMILLLLRQLDLPMQLVLVYAWHPVFVIEFAANAHLDSMGIFFFLLSLWLMLRGKPAWSGAALGLSIASKGYALLTLPLFLRYSGRRWWSFALCAVASMALTAIPFIGAGSGLWRGVWFEVTTMQVNAGLFLMLQKLCERLTAHPQTWTHALELAIVGATVLLLSRSRPPSNVAFVRRLLWALGVYFLVAPVVQPWYFGWLVPLLCLSFDFAWLYLSGAFVLSYAQFGTGAVSVKWLSLAEYAPFYILLIFFLTRHSSLSSSSVKRAPSLIPPEDTRSDE